jgi:hypothetical protein
MRLDGSLGHDNRKLCTGSTRRKLDALIEEMLDLEKRVAEARLKAMMNPPGTKKKTS